MGLTAFSSAAGVANAVKHYSTASATIATLKAVGATGGTVFSIYLAEVGCFALVGIASAFAGAALPFAVSYGFEASTSALRSVDPAGRAPARIALRRLITPRS